MGNEVAKIESIEFAVLQQANDGQSVADMFSENLGDGGLTLGDLQKVTVPSGGGIAWTDIDEEGKETPTASLLGVIIAQRTNRALYNKPYDGTNNPPDCSSDDGKTGRGKPGGDCARCPLNQWGSAGNGRKGKMCKEKRVLYLLRPDKLLPCVINVPATSLAPLRKYMISLTNMAIPVFSAITVLSLKKVEKPGTPAYSEIVFSKAKDGTLTQEQSAAMRKYAQEFANVLATTSYVPAGTGVSTTETTDTEEDTPFGDNDEV